MLLNRLQLLKCYDLPVLERRSRQIVQKSVSLLHAGSAPLIFHVSKRTKPLTALKKATCKILEKSPATFQSELLGSEICALSFLYRIETTVLAEPAGGGVQRRQRQQKCTQRLGDSLSANVLLFPTHMFVRMFYSQLFHLLPLRAGMNRPRARGSCECSMLESI